MKDAFLTPSVFYPVSLVILTTWALFGLRDNELGTLRDALKQSALLIVGGAVFVAIGFFVGVTFGLAKDHVAAILLFQESSAGSRPALALGYLAILLGAVVALRAFLKARRLEEPKGT